MSLWLIILISCGVMILKDWIATFLTVAEAKNNKYLAGIYNAMGTPANAIFYSVSMVSLLHGHGIWGLLGLLPIMCIDFVDGLVFTPLAHRMKGSPVKINRKTA